MHKDSSDSLILVVTVLKLHFISLSFSLRLLIVKMLNLHLSKILVSHIIQKQEAQLSLTGRVTLRVVENFAELLKIFEITPLSMLKFLLAFHCNYVSILYRF